jgi:hypothetical protein
MFQLMGADLILPKILFLSHYMHISFDFDYSLILSEVQTSQKIVFLPTDVLTLSLNFTLNLKIINLK